MALRMMRMSSGNPEASYTKTLLRLSHLSVGQRSAMGNFDITDSHSNPRAARLTGANMSIVAGERGGESQAVWAGCDRKYANEQPTANVHNTHRCHAWSSTDGKHLIPPPMHCYQKLTA